LFEERSQGLHNGHSLPSSAHHQGQTGGLQALAARPLQEGRPMRIFARIRPQPDARMLLFLKILLVSTFQAFHSSVTAKSNLFSGMQQQGMPFPTH